MTESQKINWWLIFHKFQKSREKIWQPKIYSALQNQITSVTDAIKSQGIPYATSRIDFLVRFNEISEIIKSIYIDAGKVFGGKAYQLVKKQGRETKAMMPIGYNKELINEIIRHFQLSLLNEAVMPISETTKRFILNVLIKSQQEGVSINDIVKELEGSDITRTRARLIARTETVKASNYGAVASAKKTGYDTNKIWISAQDMRTRRVPRDEADHLHANGQMVPLNEPFKIRDKKNAGGYINMMYPGDPAGGAENCINCRCVTGFKIVD